MHSDFQLSVGYVKAFFQFSAVSGPDADGWTVVGSAQNHSMIGAPGSQQRQSTQQNTNHPQLQSTSLGNANWASNFPLMNQNDSKANQANNPYSQYSAAVGMSFSNATNLQQQQNMNQWNPNIHYGGQISFQNVVPSQPAWQQPSSMAATVNSFSMSPSSSFDFGNLQIDSRFVWSKFPEDVFSCQIRQFQVFY